MRRNRADSLWEYDSGGLGKQAPAFNADHSIAHDCDRLGEQPGTKGRYRLSTFRFNVFFEDVAVPGRFVPKEA